MGKSCEYREKAAALLHRAMHTSDPELAAAYAKLTLQFQRLAEWAELTDARERGDGSDRPCRPGGSLPRHP